jgi:ribosomal protein S18 acetylase RimI-like enzyme
MAPVDDELWTQELGELSADAEQALRGLVSQLSQRASAPTSSELREIASSPAAHLLVARDSADTIVGMLTLAVFRIPTGVRAWIEDVVVDQRARGRGVGRRLTEKAVDLARSHGARTVELTSRPSRTAANQLYRSLGFNERETNVYRLSIEGRR